MELRTGDDEFSLLDWRLGLGDVAGGWGTWLAVVAVASGTWNDWERETRGDSIERIGVALVSRYGKTVIVVLLPTAQHIRTFDGRRCEFFFPIGAKMWADDCSVKKTSSVERGREIITSILSANWFEFFLFAHTWYFNNNNHEQKRRQLKCLLASVANRTFVFIQRVDCRRESKKKNHVSPVATHHFISSLFRDDRWARKFIWRSSVDEPFQVFSVLIYFFLFDNQRKLTMQRKRNTKYEKNEVDNTQLRRAL